MSASASMGVARDERAGGKTRTVFLSVFIVGAFFIGTIVRRWLWG